jgi:hypothetical protein
MAAIKDIGILILTLPIRKKEKQENIEMVEKGS